MIIYASARAMAQYNIKPPNEISPANMPMARNILARDTGDPLREWGMNLFSFIGRNCLVTMHFASSFTLFLFDVKQNDIQAFGNIIAYYLLELYSGDRVMTQSLRSMFEEDSHLVFAPLKNRRLAVQLNERVRNLSASKGFIREYIDYRNILHTRQLNYDINFSQTCKYHAGGEEIRKEPGICFRELIVSRYGDQ